MTKKMIEYYAVREQAERGAAESARCPKSRGIHLELAERYARLARPRQKLSMRF